MIYTYTFSYSYQPHALQILTKFTAVCLFFASPQAHSLCKEPGTVFCSKTHVGYLTPDG